MAVATPRGKRVAARVKVLIPAGKATPAPPVGAGPGPARGQHYGFLQGVQRQDLGQRDGGSDHSRGIDGVRGPLVHVCDQNATGLGVVEARSRNRQGIRRPQPEQGRPGDGEGRRGDCAHQTPGPERGFVGSCHSQRQRDRAQYGHRHHGILTEELLCPTIAKVRTT